MNMTKEQVQVAIAAGLHLTDPESENVVAMKHASGAVILHQLLLAIGSGQVRLESAAPPQPQGKAPPAGKKKTSKRPARKRAQRKKK